MGVSYRWRRPLSAAIISLVLLLVVAACGTETATPPPGGGTLTPPATGPTPSRTPGPTPPPTEGPTPELPTPSLIPERGVGLYLAIHVSSNSEPFPLPGGGTVTLEDSTKAITLFVPDSGMSVLVDTYGSPGYSTSFKKPYTVGDRLFLVRHWNGSARQDYAEIGGSSHRPMGQTTASGRSDDKLYAIVGDDIFYVTEPRDGPWDNDPTELRRMSLGDFEAETLLDNAGFLHGGRLHADGEQLYWASKQDNEISFWTVNQSNGELDLISAFEVLDDEDSLSWAFAADGGSFYWAALGARGVVELWQYEHSTNAEPVMLDEVSLPGDLRPRLVQMDVAEGQIAVWLAAQFNGDSDFLLYDPSTGAHRVVDTGQRVFGFSLKHFG